MCALYMMIMVPVHLLLIDKHIGEWYDVWNELAESNEILQKNAEESRLGGPLTEML